MNSKIKKGNSKLTRTGKLRIKGFTVAKLNELAASASRPKDKHKFLTRAAQLV